jgi:hypothetical protein
MNTSGGRGRPRIFVTQAEKQKAYRERLKAAEALRNSPEVVTDPLLLKRDAARMANREHNRVAHMLLYGPEYLALGNGDWDKSFQVWHRLVNELFEAANRLHSEWYQAWKLAGYPQEARL